MTWLKGGVIHSEENDNTNESLSISLPSQGATKLKGSYRNSFRHEPKEFVCGWGAAFINITVTYPIYKLIFRQILHGVNTTSAFQQLRNEGILFLYRGIFPPLCQKTASLALMFGVYDECRRPLVEANVPTVVAKTVAGLVAGSVEAVLMPFERIQTLLQDHNYHTRFQNSGHAFRIIRCEYGYREYYRGLTPILLRNGPSNVIFFLLRDEVKNQFSTRETWYGEFLQEFVAGACIGAFISTVFYPLNVIKVHVQSRLGGPFENCWTAFVNMYNQKGLKSMYSGVHLNYTRAFVSWGVINVSYEFIKKLLYKSG